MSWLAILFIVILAGFVVWLLVDTTIFIVKKAKQKKSEQEKTKLDDSNNK